MVVRRKMLNWQNWLMVRTLSDIVAPMAPLPCLQTTDLAKRARKIARVGGANNFSEEQSILYEKFAC